MFEQVDLDIMKLRRISIGPVGIGDLSPEEIHRTSPRERKLLEQYKEAASEQSSG